MRAIRWIRAVVALVAVIACFAVAPAASAHGHVEVGEYGLTIGWANEPTFVDQPNGVELSIEHHETGEPIGDLVAVDLTVVVSTADLSTQALPLEPAFGQPGVYVADLLPTSPGDYTFHLVGSIGDQAVDVEMTSGEDTFSPVRASSEVEFPVKVPTLAEVAERLGRIDGRIEALQASAIDPQTLANLQTDINTARNAADSAATTGLFVGGAGLVVAVIALFVAWRGGRKGAGPA
jgi:hypothetical protein